MTDIRKDLLSSSKALLDLDADGVLVPHGLGGHGRTCLLWCVDEIEHLRAETERLRAALLEILDSVAVTASGVEICQCSDFDCARAALEGKDD